MYPFTSNQKYGMTVCAPLTDYKTAFTGAICEDLLPTLNYGNVKDEDNYLQNMYLSYSSRKTNYILTDKDYFWK